MPELPEVETIRRQLEPKLIGQIISDVQILSPKSFCGDPKKIIGQKIISLTRIGKQLSLNLSNNYTILAHFKMTGGLFFQPQKHTRVILKLSSRPSLSKRETPTNVGEGDLKQKDIAPLSTPSRVIARNPPIGGDEAIPSGSPRSARDDTNLYFSDLRKFGWLKLFTQAELVESQKNLGPDILSLDFTEKYFFKQLQSSSRPIKIFLLDQTKFAGIGNIYDCDSLFLSKISPLTPAKTISLSKSNTLCRNLKKIMSESILHGGSTARDRGYLMPDGNDGRHQDYFLVYQRENKKCFICNTKIKRIKQGGRSTFYCPKCQK